MSASTQPLRPAGIVGSPGTPRGDALVAMMGLTTCLLPFLVPAGPGNTALADAGILLCVVLSMLWAGREQLPIKLPYATGVAGLILGGAFAAYVSVAPVGTGLVLIQDLLLFAWSAALALGRHNPAIVRAVTVSWCHTATLYSGVMVPAYLVGLNAITGVSAKDGVRAPYTFGDPNLAGNYLVVSLFLMAACKHPRSPGVRRIAYLLVLLAIGFTGSNGAMLTLLVGLVLAVAVTAYRRRGAVGGLAVLASAALAGGLMAGFVMPRVDLGQLREQAAGSVPLLRDSFGRSANSSGERATIVSEGANLFLRGDAAGYGPARTKATLEATQAPYVKEAHNDYLATLLERGVIGAIGLLLFGVGVLARCLRLVFGNLPKAYAELVPRPWLLAVIGPVMATAAGFYEVLHFRHLWTWLGLVAALVLAMQDQHEEA
ncbi:O-antigen ligase family protein [Kribbella sp. NPDC051936]|uniref:O-antigen ligase family protein n=1 Tax=Kribbella sp. NPDC051936 TaxID=3154946 RepID=UPI00343F3FDC